MTPVTIADLRFAENYGSDAFVTANYNDDTATAIYEFSGLGNIDPVQVKFKKGTAPYYEGLNEYVEQNGGEGAAIISITPEVAPVEHSVTYTVDCSVSEPKSKHTLYFDTQGGTLIRSQQYQEESVMFIPTAPVRAGYTFTGWFTAPDAQTAFDFKAGMQQTDLTAYAQWTANSYKVNFVTLLDNKPESITIVYGHNYELPDDIKNDTKKFIGWFTESEGGTQITAQSVFNDTKDQTLYAHWEDKKEINPSWIIYDKNTSVDYDGNKHAFTFALDEQHQDINNGIDISYRKNNDEWTKNLTADLGIYDVKITRPTDNDYKALELVISDNICISKKHLAQDKLKAPVLHKAGGVVRVIGSDEIVGDGMITYYLEDKNNPKNKFSNHTGYFTNLPHGNYTAKVHVAEGTYCLGADSNESSKEEVAGIKSAEFIAQYDIYTTDGTNSYIYGGVYCDLSQENNSENQKRYEYTYLDPPGNDFEQGHSKTYQIASGLTPWQITGGFIFKGPDRGIRSQWGFSSTFTVKKGYNIHTIPFVSGEKVDTNVCIEKSGSHLFPRDIKETGNLVNGRKSVIELKKQNENYKYSYDCYAKDQFIEKYNVMEYYGAPTFTVSSGSDVFDKFINYTGLTSFEIDIPKLKEHFESNGGAEFAYTVSLIFPSGTVSEGKEIISEIIRIIDVPEKNDQSESKQNTDNVETKQVVAQKPADTPTVLMAGMNAPMILSDAKTGNTAKMTLSLKDIILNHGKEFDVSFNIGKNVSVWGILASASFDTEMLDLVGYSTGNIFSEDQFTLQKDMSKPDFKFLAAPDNTDTVSAMGNLISLRFRVKDNADNKKTAIELRTLEAVNNTGIVTIDKGNGANVIVDAKKPVVKGVENGGTYSGTTTVTVSEDNLESVTVNGTPVTVTDGKFKLDPAQGVQTIVVTDKAGNSTIVSATVNDGSKTAKDTKKNNKGNKDAPKTEDDRNPVLWIILMFVSGGIVITLIYYKKKRRQVK